MILELFLENSSFNVELIDDSNFYDRIYELEYVREKIIENKEKIYRNDQIYEMSFLNEKKLWEWLYNDNSSKYKDERLILRKLIDQASSISDERYIDIIQNVKNLQAPTPQALVCLISDSVELHITNYNDLLKSYRFYIMRVRTPEEFLEFVQVCYPNLYFHPKLIESLKTLSAPVNRYIIEIDRHLSALNDEFNEIFAAYRREGLNKVLEVFSSFSKIACTLEGDSESARKRFTFDFESNNGETVRLKCEPHTKIDRTGLPGDSKFRFDRIYFHPGSDNIADGKILIAHIGKHL
ncbi:hypothetical protein [Desulforamulus aquiferis]|uniref:Uncharacterized protein n=1 Tax=Desulforamulus aquiferis TaxID=1397668 RepID=A0AAW7ZEB9_9FIRM|nr:hypothetical protein [Desulforamulus aquiferis]MDO7787865.1 hypothetical protein [Desulforamulus aquiferis]